LIDHYLRGDRFQLGLVSVGVIIDIVNSFNKLSLSPLSPRHHLTPDPPMSYLGKTKNKKRNSLAHPRPGTYHPPDLVLLRAHPESDEVDEGAGLVGRRGFL
jgi:hypothetical protein